MEKLNVKSLNNEVLYHAKRIGITMLEPYERYDKKMRFRVDTGEYAGLTGEISYTGLRRTKKLSYNSLDTVSKRIYWDATAQERGCTILEYDTEYRVNHPIKIRDRYGRELKTDFTTLRRSKRNHKGWSYGEHMVATLLTANNISFTRQALIKTVLGKQYLDFLVQLPDGRQVAIEYNGIQHYEDTPCFSLSLAEQKRYDQVKADWCNANNVLLIVIPYTEDSLAKVSEWLAPIGIRQVPEKLVILPDIEQQVVNDYIYNKLTRAEVADKYGISEFLVTNIAKRHNKVHVSINPRSREIEKIEWDILYDYIYLGRDRATTAKKYKICLNTVTNIAKKNGFVKSANGNINPRHGQIGYEHLMNVFTGADDYGFNSDWISTQLNPTPPDIFTQFT